MTLEHFLPDVSDFIEGGSLTSGPKGFSVPNWMHPLRNTAVDAGDGFAWAVSNRPGATPINGGRNRAIRKRAGGIRQVVFNALVDEGQSRKMARKNAYGRHTPKGALAIRRVVA